jgi:hypothetical protein
VNPHRTSSSTMLSSLPAAEDEEKGVVVRGSGGEQLAAFVRFAEQGLGLVDAELRPEPELALGLLDHRVAALPVHRRLLEPLLLQRSKLVDAFLALRVEAPTPRLRAVARHRRVREEPLSLRPRRRVHRVRGVHHLEVSRLHLVRDRHRGPGHERDEEAEEVQRERGGRLRGFGGVPSPQGRDDAAGATGRCVTGRDVHPHGRIRRRVSHRSDCALQISVKSELSGSSLVLRVLAGKIAPS